MTEPHTAGEHWVAQEGAYAAATSNVSVLHYFPARGRAEPIRLALALVRQPWFEPPVEPLAAVMRCQLDSYPFRQLPRFVEDGGVDLVQSMAILRHLGRKHKLYGCDDSEAASIDVVLEAVADLRARLKDVWCGGSGLGDPQAVAAYVATVLAPEQQLVRLADVPGPGLACLERLLSGAHRQWPAACDEPPEGGAEARRDGVAAGSSGSSNDRQSLDAADALGGLGLSGSSSRHGGAGGEPAGERCRSEEALDGGPAGLTGGDDDEGCMFIVGDRISIADIVVADLVDIHLAASQFEAPVRTHFPHLVLLRRRVMGQPGIREYLSSNNRHTLIWGQDWQPSSHNKDASMMATAASATAASAAGGSSQ